MQAQWSDGKGETQRSIYHRHFCRKCGCQLWAWAPSDPDTICPFASAIDTHLPTAKKRKHYMLAEAPEWVQVWDSFRWHVQVHVEHAYTRDKLHEVLPPSCRFPRAQMTPTTSRCPTAR